MDDNKQQPAGLTGLTEGDVIYEVELGPPNLGTYTVMPVDEPRIKAEILAIGTCDKSEHGWITSGWMFDMHGQGVAIQISGEQAGIAGWTYEELAAIASGITKLPQSSPPESSPPH